MTKVITVNINPWEEDKFQEYMFKLTDIKYIRKEEYTRYQDEADWFYAIEIYFNDKFAEEFGQVFVTEEFKTPQERDQRFVELADIINQDNSIHKDLGKRLGL